MDLTATIAPKSDQLNADDLLAHPMTVTIAGVREGNDEQPVWVDLVEFPGRPFKPSKTVRRVFVAAWGPDTSVYAGRSVTLYCDPAVKFGGQAVGGIRISHMSHLDRRLTLALTATRGKKASHVIEPLPDAAPPAAPVLDIDTATDMDALRDLWGAADQATRGRIKARIDHLTAQGATS